MPSLKDLKTRINSVKSTQKITSAMKMVAAAKLRRAQDSAERGRPYADRMQQIINSLAAKADPASAPQLLVGNGQDRTHLLVVISADRGLCGGFNGAITRQTRNEVARLLGEGKTVKLLLVGRKSADALRRELGDLDDDGEYSEEGDLDEDDDFDDENYPYPDDQSAARTVNEKNIRNLYFCRSVWLGKLERAVNRQPSFRPKDS